MEVAIKDGGRQSLHKAKKMKGGSIIHDNKEVIKDERVKTIQKVVQKDCTERLLFMWCSVRSDRVRVRAVRIANG